MRVGLTTWSEQKNARAVRRSDRLLWGLGAAARKGFMGGFAEHLRAAQAREGMRMGMETGETELAVTLADKSDNCNGCVWDH